MADGKGAFAQPANELASDADTPAAAHTTNTRLTPATLQAIAGLLPDLILVYDREGHYCQCLGGNAFDYILPPPDLIGRTLAEVLPPEPATMLQKAIARVLEHGGRERLEYELAIGGELRYREARLMPFDVDQVLAIVRDITEAKRAEIARQEAEARRRENEILLQALGDNLPNGYLYQLIISPVGSLRYTYLSAGVERTVGISVAEVMRNPNALVDQVIAEDRAALDAASSAALANLTTYSIQVRKQLASGELRWALIRSAPRPPLADGSVIWDGVVLDITDFKHAEQALQESMKRYRALFNVENVGIAITDTNCVMIEVNETFANMLGYTSRELIGRNFIEITPPDERAVELQNVARIMADGEGKVRNWFEKRYLHRNGETVWARLAVEIIRDEAGEPWLMTAVVTDITASKRAAVDLLLRNHALEAVTLGVVITDYRAPDQPVIYANQGFMRITGYREEEILGRNCRYLQGPETDPAATAKIRMALAKRESCVVQLVNYRKDGTRFWNALTLSPITDAAHEVTHYIGIQADISELKQLEAAYQQAQKMEAVGRLAGGMAHDFNNLLTVIGGYSDLLLHSLDQHDANRAKVEQIRLAGDRAASLTRQLLAFSRKQVIQPAVINLNTLVLNLLPMLHSLVGDDVELATHLAPDLWSIRADPSQIEQVIMNLVVNARDAMPNGGQSTITTANLELSQADVEVYPLLTPGPHVMLTVSDTGHGMDGKTMAHLFEPFFTTKGPGQGTGLGLATAYGIVQQSSGAIDVYSKVGWGSIFKLLFPSVPLTSATTSADTPPPAQQIAQASTVLLVDDEHQIRNLASSILRTSGYEVLEAASAADALELCAQVRGRVDLLVTDVMMPGMNGRQLSDRLTTEYPELKVLFVSGYSHDLLSARGILDYSVSLLLKPYTPMMLQNRVRELLEIGASPAPPVTTSGE